MGPTANSLSHRSSFSPARLYAESARRTWSKNHPTVINKDLSVTNPKILNRPPHLQRLGLPVQLA